MKQIAFLITLLTLALADKPAPEYKASASTLKTVGAKAKAEAKVDTISARQDTYGSPAAPAQDSYGSPAAPAKDSYGSPAAPVKDSYGSPAADPVAPPAQGTVGTQGYYYYYYPVASSSTSGGYGGAGHKTGTASSSGGGLLSGGLLIPLVLGLVLLLLLAFAAATLFRTNGRSLIPDIGSMFANASPYFDELAVTVYDALKVYAELNDVTTAR